MPSRNIVRFNAPGSYYHVYARGVNKQPIFLDEDDGAVFLNLLKRYLSPTAQKDNSGRIYPHLRGKVELLCYCLMKNHFHMLIFQAEANSMSQLMKGVMGSYGTYFNKKYKRRGPLFESRYKASWITHESYLQHISRYIHLNPKDWQNHPFSSIHSYLGVRQEDWLQPQKIAALFRSVDNYKTFVSDYVGHKNMLDELKHELAE